MPSPENNMKWRSDDESFRKQNLPTANNFPTSSRFPFRSSFQYAYEMTQ